MRITRKYKKMKTKKKQKSLHLSMAKINIGGIHSRNLKFLDKREQRLSW